MPSYVILSPHPDDAILSCGGFLLGAAKGRAHVVRVFDGAGADQGSVLGSHRDAEDFAALASVPVTHSSARFPEALARGERPIALWPGSAADHPLVDPVAGWLQNWLEANPAGAVLAPLGIGDHIDHLIVFDASLKVFHSGSIPELWFYEDVPYRALASARQARLFALGLGGKAAPGRRVRQLFPIWDDGYRHVFPKERRSRRIFWTAKWRISRFTCIVRRRRGLPAFSERAVDISEVLQRKAEIVALYRSQVPVLFTEKDAVIRSLIEAGSGAEERFWIAARQPASSARVGG